MEGGGLFFIMVVASSFLVFDGINDYDKDVLAAANIKNFFPLSKYCHDFSISNHPGTTSAFFLLLHMHLDSPSFK